MEPNNPQYDLDGGDVEHSSSASKPAEANTLHFTNPLITPTFSPGQIVDLTPLQQVPNAVPVDGYTYDFKGKSPEDLNTQLTALESKLAATEKKLGRFEQRQRKLESDLDKNQLKLVETLGVFAAIFAFISVSVDVLKNVTNVYVLAGLEITTASLLAIFILVLDVVVRQWRYDIEMKDNPKNFQRIYMKPHGIILAIVVLLFIVSGFLLLQGNRQMLAQQDPKPVAQLTKSTGKH